jgi:hypothetical protein
MTRGTNGVVAGAAAGVADVRVALAEACEFGGVKSRVHASKDGEAARRRHRELCLGAEVLRVGLVCREHLLAYLGHRGSPLFIHLRFQQVKLCHGRPAA